MKHGVVENWDDMELLWKHIFNTLNTSTKEQPAFLTESSINPKSNRIKMARVFFETFNSPALFVGNQAVMSLFPGGKTTGVVLDSGDGVTHVVPVFKGFSLPHAI